ncbi:sensor domain-containing diguanylate cyclase [Clostridium aminobutyricum]|uniref:Sensor domain-containing diguanylate cyclase n=1 Tax=Clostridium aminobutyricum TaxID=33953 RepID=A0A939II43_CLOAM|nr:sensor domain-containing diguanylate cyclase [Clostridium aminobutyricum]MBN7774537.1 sensor domain-containing diguanylate cyclase [Clostridium aminobutyricum]
MVTNDFKSDAALREKSNLENLKNNSNERAIRDIKVPLGSIMDAVRDAIVILDGLGRIVTLNLLAAQFFGYSHDEMIGTKLCDYVLSDEKFDEHYRNSFITFQEDEEKKLFRKGTELKIKQKEGKEIEVNLSFSFLEIGNSRYAMGIFRDTTDIKNTLIELENSRKQYEQLTENAPLGIISCDEDGNIVYVNQKTLEILGSPSVEETKKINLRELPLLVDAGFSTVLTDCLEMDKTVSYEMDYESKWHKRVWLRVHIKPRVDRGTVIGAQIIIEDISEKRKFEEEKRNEQERQRRMLKGIPSPAWLISKDFRILAQNDVAMALFKKKIGDDCRNESSLGEASFFYQEPFDIGESNNKEVQWEDSVWDTWWIPVGEDVYLYYATNITKYKKIEEKLFQLSVTDELTNTYNRRYFVQRLEEEIERANRAEGKFSLIMLDIDHFKEINDTLGHNVGDLVLKRCTQEVLQNRIRRIDKLARWGGEEFVLLLPGTTMSNAIILAEDLRENLSKLEIEEVGRVTASFGIVEFTVGDTVETIIQKADEMMYKAKAAGRNCVQYE